MLLQDWKYELIDIRDFPNEILDPNESVLANSVDIANHLLLQRMKQRQKILEIGCGSKSFLLNNLPDKIVWEGIDIFDVDDRGRQSIATRLGSVDYIPFENNQFDWVVANQSIEHWFEFNVGISESIQEIARVLKVGGHALLNFPMHLHGHPSFVLGDLDSILKNIDKNTWSISAMTAFKDRENLEYKGWRRCGFPDWYVNKIASTKTSFVVELDIKKISDAKDLFPEVPAARELKIKPRLSEIRRALAHGIPVLGYKIYRKILRGRTGNWSKD